VSQVLFYTGDMEMEKREREREREREERRAKHDGSLL
jgi:hypothetical protein